MYTKKITLEQKIQNIGYAEASALINIIIEIVDDLICQDISVQDKNKLHAHGNIFMEICEQELDIKNRIMLYAYAISLVQKNLCKVRGTQIEKTAHHWMSKLKLRQLALKEEI